MYPTQKELEAMVSASRKDGELGWINRLAIHIIDWNNEKLAEPKPVAWARYPRFTGSLQKQEVVFVEPEDVRSWTPLYAAPTPLDHPNGGKYFPDHVPYHTTPNLPAELNLAEGLSEDKDEPFIVKHYSSDERPIIKGNGFDGLEIGADREEAERFVAWINARLNNAALGETK